jgi:hypothetical protein
MKAQETIRRLAEANPVPDPGRLHEDRADVDRLFSAIERRRLDMTGTTTRPVPRVTPPTPPRPWYRRPAAVLLIAAAAVLATAVPLAYFGGRGDTPDVADTTPATTSAPQTPTTAPPATTQPVAPTTAAAMTTTPPVTLPPPGTASWIAVPDLAVFEGSFVSAIAAHGGGFVAFGKGQADWTPQAWTSHDGLNWTSASAGIAGSSEPIDETWLLEFGDGLVVLANGMRSGPEGSSPPPLVWTSEDGGSWSRVATEMTGFGEGDRIAAAATFGSSIVAIGSDAAGHVQWTATSNDGRTWIPARDSADAFAGYLVADLTAGGPGLVAVGTLVTGENDAAVWTSMDGTSWDRVVDDATFGGPGNQWIEGVASGPGGTVAVGNSYVEGAGVRGAMWVSPDGATWARVADEDDTLFAAFAPGANESAVTIQDVAAVGPGFVATGALVLPDGDLGAIWISPDGRTWMRIDEVEGAALPEYLGIVTTGDEAVVVAGEGGPRFGMLIWRP